MVHLSPTQEELKDYKESLTRARHKLVVYQNTLPEFRMDHISEHVVLICAIDGLMLELKQIDPLKLTLNQIVSISDKVKEVLASVNVFATRNGIA